MKFICIEYDQCWNTKNTSENEGFVICDINKEEMMRSIKDKNHMRRFVYF